MSTAGEPSNAQIRPNKLRFDFVIVFLEFKLVFRSVFDPFFEPFYINLCFGWIGISSFVFLTKKNEVK